MILGIDTASIAGNKNIDWTAAKAAGVSFAFLRASFATTVDPLFVREWPRLGQAGMVRGAYLFLTFPRGRTRAPDPEAQVKTFIDTLGDVQPNDLPPSLDLEFPGDGRSETGMTASQCLDWTLRAYKALRTEYGVAPILYTSARIWRDELGQPTTTDLVESPLWLARYYFKERMPARTGAAFGDLPTPPVPPPWGDDDNFWIHQFQGSATGFAGFPTGDVDLNRFNPFFTGKGARARWVQKRLGVTVDGVFGDGSKDALADFQATRGLVADRVIGPRTFAYLAWQVV